MSEEVQSHKKCSIEEGKKDETPKDCGDTGSENIAKSKMEGNKRSSPRKKDIKDTGSVALERFDLDKKRKSRGDDDSSEEAEDWGGGKRKLSKREDEEYVPEPPTKRRRLVRSVQETVSSEEIAPFRQSRPGRARKVVKRAGKKNTPKKSKAPKKKAKAQCDDRSFEVEKIMKVKILKNGKKEFLIRWKGFSAEHDTWEPEANLTCKDLVNQFFEEHKEEIDASGEGDKKSNSGTSKRRGSSGPSRSTKTDSAADVESSAKGSTKKAGGSSKQSPGKGKKMLTRARNTGVKTGKDEAALTDSEKEGDAETGKAEREVETSRKRGSSPDAGEKGERRRTSASGDSKEYEVERIVDVRQPKDGDREFLIKWRGYPNKFNSWESENDMNCSEKIEKFLKSMEQNSSERELRLVRKKTNRFVADDGGRGRKMSLRLGKMPRKSYSEID